LTRVQAKAVPDKIRCFKKEVKWHKNRRIKPGEFDRLRKGNLIEDVIFTSLIFDKKIKGLDIPPNHLQNLMICI